MPFSERVVVNMLRFSIRLMPSAETTDHIMKLLALLLPLPHAVLLQLAERVAAGLLVFVQVRPVFISLILVFIFIGFQLDTGFHLRVISLAESRRVSRQQRSMEGCIHSD